MATAAEWADVARDLRSEDFEPLLLLILQSDLSNSLGLTLAFVVFTGNDTKFRDFLAEALLRAETFRPGAPTMAARVVLRALVQAAARLTAPHLGIFKALAKHRIFEEGSSISTLGRDVRAALLRQRDLVGELPAEAFVPPFCFALIDTPHPGAPFATEWDDRAFLQDLFCRLAAEGTRAALDWLPGVAFPEQPLSVLATTLATVFNDAAPYGQTEKDVRAAILATVERCVQIWSARYRGYSPLPPQSTVDPRSGLQAEAFLREILRRLVHHEGKTDGFFGSGGVALYQDWITLCGGFTAADADAFVAGQFTVPMPMPAYRRDWHAAEKLGRGAPLLWAVAPHMFVRWFDRLRKPDFDPPSDRTGDEAWTNFDYLAKMGEELRAVALAQGMVSALDWQAGAAVVGPDLGGATVSALMPQLSTPRTSTAAALHPDHRRALRIVTACLLQWRAEIAYRKAGPRSILSGFTPGQQAEIDRAALLYRAALALIGEGAGEPFAIGLGLLGVELLAERDGVRDECLLRLKQLGRGGTAAEALDWTADAPEWPLTYLDDINRQVAALLQTLKTLGASIDLSFQKRDFDDAIIERTLAKQQAEELHAAALDLDGAETSTLEALKREHDAADARARAAENRKREAEYLAAARKYARDAQNDEAQARQALEHVEEETARQLAGQIELLRGNVADLRQKLPVLQEAIQTASANLDRFQKDASDRHRAKQSQRALFSILKKVGSLVSIYFTGVDLVTIAETAIQAVRSASSGDWAGAIIHARDAADMATGGKFSQALSRGIESAERYIGSVMSDSLQGAAEKIGSALGVPPGDALKGAIDAVGRQAFRIGVSFLARETGMTEVAHALGIPDPSPTVFQNLRTAAEAQLVDAAWNAFKRQASTLDDLGKALGVVAPTPTGIEEALRSAVLAAQHAGKSAEQEIVAIVAKVRERNPAADGIIANLKEELLNGRAALIDRVAGAANRGREQVGAALDRLASAALTATAAGNLPLPPIVLPADVVAAIRAFRLEVETARSKIGFLTAPGQADNLANQLADYEDDEQFQHQLDKIVGDLKGSIAIAQDSMQKAEGDLAVLEAKLGEAQVAQYKQQFQTEAAHWRTLAAQNLGSYENELLGAAGEAVVAAEQQIQIERFAAKATESRIAAQVQIVSARQAQADAAATEIQLRDIALKRARASQTRWEQQTDAPDADQARQLETVRLFCLNRATALLAQAWQLLQIYEVDPDRVGHLPRSDSSPLSYVPTFLVQTPTSIQMGLELLKLAQAKWNLSLLETPSPLATISLGAIANGLDPAVRARLQSALTEVGGDTYPCATFQTRADVVRLIQGVTFRIASLSGRGHPLPAGYPRWMSPSVYTDTAGAGLSVEEDRVAGWDDEGAFRIRLLGVLVRVQNHGGLPPNRPLKVFLRQEADCGIVVRDPSGPGHRRYLPVPLTSVHGEDDRGRGVRLPPGTIVTRQWETRPLLGSYTVRLGHALPDFSDADQFRIEIHFVAIGRP